MAIGHGNGKLLLFGEHAAVFGKPAVGVGLPLTITIRVDDVEPGGHRMVHLESDDAARFESLCSFIDTLELPFAAPRNKSISVSSSIPRAAGLGSSAAFSVALVRAMLPPESDIDEPTLWANANTVEQYFHGTPSGIDTGLALLGGIRALFPNPPGIPSSRELPGIPLSIVVGTVSRENSTKALVSRIRGEVASGNMATIKRIDYLGRLSEQAILCLENDGDVFTLAALATDAHRNLCELALSTAPLERALEKGREFGAVGGKLSGAGGGGAFYLIFAHGEEAYLASTRLAVWALQENLPVTIRGVFSIRSGSVVNES